MPQLKNDTLIRGLVAAANAVHPDLADAQAGRYLPEYKRRARRAGNFLALCRNPDLATEVTLQPLARFRWTRPRFLGHTDYTRRNGPRAEFVDNEGPRLERPLREERDIFNLAAPDPDRSLRYVLDTVAQARRALAGSVPLIGFAGSRSPLPATWWRGVRAPISGKPDHACQPARVAARILQVNAPR